VVLSFMNEEALLQIGQMGVGKMAYWIQLFQNLLLHSFCDTAPPSTPSKKSRFSFLDEMKPNPRDCPLRWVSFFFLFLSPRPWPAKVSSKKNPATYPSQLPTHPNQPSTYKLSIVVTCSVVTYNVIRV
jgi:hypothetical protein